MGLVILAGVFVSIREPAKKFGDSAETSPAGSGRINIPLTLMICLTAFFLGFMLFLLLTKLPYLIDTLLPESSVITGLILGTIGVFTACSGLAYGKISRCMNRMTILSIVFLMTAFGFSIIGAASTIVLIGIGAAFVGFATGMLFPTLFSWLAQITPIASLGFVTGMITTLAYFGEFNNSWIIPQLEALTGSQSGVFFVAGVVCLIPATIYGLIRVSEEKKKMCRGRSA